MRQFYLVFIIFAFCVKKLVSQKMDSDRPNPYANLEPFEMEDFSKPPQTESPFMCHIPHMKCIKKLKGSNPLCALTKDMGLVDFKNICEIHLQNCIARPADVNNSYGFFRKNDVIFYNGKEQSCHYYMKQTKSLEDAMRLYHKDAYGMADDDNNIDENMDYF